MPAPKKPTKRSIAAKELYEKRKVGRLHTIAERRAKSAGMSKKEYIAAIMKGQFRPITAEDIANEPDAPVEDKDAPQIKSDAAPSEVSASAE